MVDEQQKQNTRWTPVGADLFCPVAIGRQPGHITLLARSATGELFFREWTVNGWSQFYSLGLPLAPANGSRGPVPADWQLAACSGEPDRIDVFARSPDGDLLHMTQKQSTWGTFECLGAPALIRENIAIPMGLASPPAACSWNSQQIDVFAVGPEGDLLHTSWKSKGWTGFESLGVPTVQIAGKPQPVPLSGSPAACRCGENRMGVFVRGPQGDLILKWWDGTRWSEFASLGFPEVQYDLYPAVKAATPLTGPPAACSWGPERIDVFARGPGGDLLHKWWDGKDWSSFESLGRPIPADGGRSIPFTGSVTACTWGPRRLDVFARALDGTLYHAWWDGTWDHE